MEDLSFRQTENVSFSNIVLINFTNLQCFIRQTSHIFEYKSFAITASSPCFYSSYITFD